MKGTNIGFCNPFVHNGNEAWQDEVQFNCRPDELTELALCWFDFCKDEGIISYVEEVEVKDE